METLDIQQTRNILQNLTNLEISYMEYSKSPKDFVKYQNFLEYFNNPHNQKKFQYFGNLEKELIYYFEQLSDTDKRELIEIAKIKTRK